jgi:serine phosphatase RsbU (regulator of sigma subunit)
VARKAISELGEGIRDGAAARAAHDFLYAHRGGKVSATLNILSVDLTTDTLVISRNSRCPIVHVDGEGVLSLIDEPSEPIGVRRGTKPQITELPLAPGTVIVAYTDGLETAGSPSTVVFDVPAAVAELVDQGSRDAKRLADGLLGRALELDQGRPRDDISVVVLCVTDRPTDGVRRMALSLPLSGG